MSWWEDGRCAALTVQRVRVLQLFFRLSSGGGLKKSMTARGSRESHCSGSGEVQPLRCSACASSRRKRHTSGGSLAYGWRRFIRQHATVNSTADYSCGLPLCVSRAVRAFALSIVRRNVAPPPDVQTDAGRSPVIDEAARAGAPRFTLTGIPY
ncbi:unnamed protein product [Amoebophrya sp. A120]|nr:unnamed protein product [Amoebophrya sp. A120]|eukprot:GSA120T00005712001.1